MPAHDSRAAVVAATGSLESAVAAPRLDHADEIGAIDRRVR
jgi:hypothetical protein